MLDSEGFDLVTEGTLVGRIPLDGKYYQYYATQYGRILFYCCSTRKWKAKREISAA